MRWIGLVLCAFIAATGAKAATLEITYGSGLAALGARLTGALAPDGNSFIIGGGSNFTRGGAVIYDSPPVFFGSYLALVVGATGLAGGTAGLVTLDGSAIDLAVLADNGNDGFFIGAGSLVESVVASSVAHAAGSFGDLNQPFDPSLWHATLQVDSTPVPEPLSAALLGAGLLGLGLVRRRAA
ncbi:PEP-CTERM sorting domain-containing protein [Paracraurococcus lichenis]|uniref:PEP-CTERM sorting domain-containing protein n=1 Tax=Paracraurococcus lichenis TaxID=3064888 RepID=A0ABT9E3B6_9PROT|nr:PEP-CTERM sorting domain-containing protein [Paracraurococcus sp. LOR1-02]MDO9710659.1 PEP-CTERM sorting domain-containing protein [Paracraurococcus sp. LOR1-02]